MTPFKSAAKFLSLRIRPWGLITAGGAILSTATVLGFFGSFWWFFDLFSHLRVQYFFGLSAVALLLLFPRRGKAFAFFGLLAIANFCTIAPLYFGKEPRPPEVSRSYRSLLMNVNTESGSPDKVAQAIKRIDPDIMVLEEINNQWLSVLSVPLRAYPYSQTMPREDNFGIALYSKHPFIRSEIRQVGEADIPSVVAELELPDGRLTVIATHPLPPGGAEYSRLRNDQLARLPGLVKQARSPVLMLGDLNVTPWCSHFNQLLSQSGMRNSSQGRGVLPTWPTFFPLLLIPLDHCLHTKGIHISRITIGPKVGSDHYPLVVDFVLIGQARKMEGRLTIGAIRTRLGDDGAALGERAVKDGRRIASDPSDYPGKGR
jgi:endonuclease/exonuclease/phosphatase (EEP) superfamily protein YafD